MERKTLNLNTLNLKAIGVEIIKIETLFKIGEVVYFVTDEMQKPYLITAIVIQEKSIKYKVANSSEQEVECFGFEITETKKII